MTIGDILATQARTRPEALAMVDCRGGRERRLTFVGLEQEVERAAAWLAARGIRRGDAALVFVPMSADLYVALLALFRLGAVALFLDPSAGRAHLEQCCARWPPRALLAIPRAHLLRVRSRALRRVPLAVAVGGWAPWARRWLSGMPGPTAPRVAVAADDPALVTFTSGSTGVPKGAVRSHAFLVAQHRALAPNIALAAGDVDFATLPVFTLANLASGVTTVIGDVDLKRPGAVDAARVFEALERHRVNRITASPAFFERLVAHGRATGRTLPGLKKIHTGGAPVLPRLLEALCELAPSAQSVAVYGSTEAEPIAHLARDEIAPSDHAAMQAGGGLLAGRPVPEIELRILRDRWGTPRAAMTRAQLAAETLPPGEVGEIVVTGEQVLGGYLGGIGDTETKFTVDGATWHRTGDAGKLDDAGRLWLLGRCAAKIEDAGGCIYPFAIECLALTFPEVSRAALVETGGRRLLVFEGPAGAGEKLRAAVAWARVDEVRALPHIPVDARHNAKIDYPALRRLLGE